MLLLVLAPLAVVFLASWLLLVPTLENAFLESRKEYLQPLSETAYGVLEGQEAQAKAGVITREEAQKRALELIKAIRFGKTGYFYVFTRDLRIVTVPIKPEMEGQLVDSFKDAGGQLIYVELNQMCIRDRPWLARGRLRARVVPRRAARGCVGKGMNTPE